MPLPPILIRALLQQIVETSSRSTILRPLGVLLSILVPATIASYYFNLPPWLGVSFASSTFITLALYLTVYVVAFKKDPELLRSEKHSIQKLAIEKGLVGDSLQGIFDLNPVSERGRLAGPSQEDPETSR